MIQVQEYRETLHLGFLEGIHERDDDLFKDSVFQ